MPYLYNKLGKILKLRNLKQEKLHFFEYLAGTTKNDSNLQENLKSGICGALLLCSYVCVPCTHILTQLLSKLSDNFLISTDRSETEIRI